MRCKFKHETGRCREVATESVEVADTVGNYRRVVLCEQHARPLQEAIHGWRVTVAIGSIMLAVALVVMMLSPPSSPWP